MNGTLTRRTAVGALLASVAAMPAFALIRPGQQAPNFTLDNSNGGKTTLEQYRGKLVVLEWTNKDCPIVGKHYAKSNMQELQRKYTAKGIVWLSIASSAKGQEGYVTAADANAWQKKVGAAPTQYLLDPEGVVGHLYDAKATPHMFIIDKDGKILYNGAIDSIHSGKVEDIPYAKNFVSSALEEILANKPVTVKVSAPYGCLMRYKDYVHSNDEYRNF